MKRKYIIANWKMQKSHQESVAWCLENYEELKMLGSKENIKLVLCPSFTALAPIYDLLRSTGISIGGQDCGFKDIGPYTGDVSVISLKEIGSDYCIVGHSESRIYHHETNQSVAQKTELLINNGITPILCIGETAQEHINQNYIQILKEQLKPVLEKIKNKPVKNLLVAYEPVWVIGTNQVPTREVLEEISDVLVRFFNDEYPQIPITLIYGGGIDDKTINHLNTISQLHGFLLGRSGLDFQMLKNIVLSCLGR